LQKRHAGMLASDLTPRQMPCPPCVARPWMAEAHQMKRRGHGWPQVWRALPAPSRWEAGGWSGAQRPGCAEAMDGRSASNENGTAASDGLVHDAGDSLDHGLAGDAADLEVEVVQGHALDHGHQRVGRGQRSHLGSDLPAVLKLLDLGG